MANALHSFANRSEATPERDALGEPDSHDSMIRNIISGVMHRSTKSRAQIADEMSLLVGVEITATMLNNYAAPCRTGVRFPAAFIAAFCQVTGDQRLQRLLLGPTLNKKIEILEHELTAVQEKHQAQLLREQLVAEQKSLPLFADAPDAWVVLQPVPVRSIRSRGGVR